MNGHANGSLHGAGFAEGGALDPGFQPVPHGTVVVPLSTAKSPSRDASAFARESVREAQPARPASTSSSVPREQGAPTAVAAPTGGAGAAQGAAFRAPSADTVELANGANVRPPAESPGAEAEEHGALRAFDISAVPDSAFDPLCGECSQEEEQEAIIEAEDAADRAQQAREALDAAAPGPEKEAARARWAEVDRERNEAVDRACLMICCEGSCLRSFHVGCLAPQQRPAEGEDWLCGDCATRTHMCSICGEHDGDEMPTGVFRCSKTTCPSFFHIACLARAPWRERTRWKAAPALDPLLDAIAAESVDDVPARLNGYVAEHGLPELVCPRHMCDVCEKRSTISGRGKAEEYQTCRYCPRGFHVKCIPPGAKFNDLVFHCPHHREIPLPKSYMWRGLVQAAKTKGSSRHKERVSTATVARIGRRGYAIMPGLEVEGQFGMPVLHAPQGSFQLPKALVHEMLTRPPRFGNLRTNRYTPAAEAVMRRHISRRRSQLQLGSGDSTYGVCSCAERCGDECENRLLRIECFGGESETAGPGTTGPEPSPSPSPSPEDGDEGADAGTAGAAAEAGAEAAPPAKRRRRPPVPTNCACGPGCGNRRFAQRLWKRVTPFRTGSRGWGLRAAEPLRAGEFVIEYTGEVIDAEEQQQRLEESSRRGERNYFIMNLDTTLGLSIDARLRGCVTRFANHSCDPNCEVQRWDVARGRMSLGLFALRDVKVGEEITYDYQFATTEETECLCGAATCRGFLSTQVARARRKEREAAAAAQEQQ